MKDYIKEIITLFTQNRYSKEITQEFHQWLINTNNSSEKEKALHKIWVETNNKPKKNNQSLHQIYNRLNLPFRKKSNLVFYKYAAAAVIFGISLCSTFFITKNIYDEGNITMCEKYIPNGTNEKIILPDGTRVLINSGSLLIYPNQFKNKTRTVYLIGEANFKVKKNSEKPFIVKSEEMLITALGTEFNVKAYPKEQNIIATLLKGKIKINWNKNKNQYILNPGEQLIYNKKTLITDLKKANINDVIAWQKGKIVFRGKTIKQILFTLEKQFNTTFECNTELLSHDKYNFSFRKDAQLTEIMEVIKAVTCRFTYEIDENICYIKFKK